jgi:MFS family permease
MGLIVTARLLDRVGKGIRGAPRDALVADLAPPEMRGATFGLRQSLDTAGAFIGPLFAMTLMLLWANDFRAVFWAACVPAVLCMALLLWGGVQEPEHAPAAARVNPISRASLSRLSGAYWWVVGIGAVFTLARFSESFLVLRAQQGGLPLVLIVLNLVFSLGAYPLGRLSDAVSRTKVLIAGLLVLIAADGLLAWSDHGAVFWAGVALWGLHMALTQGLLATLVANAAPADLSGTAYGMFNLVCGMALLVASGLAGWLWDRLGAPSTFMAGMGFGLLALLAIAWRSRTGRLAP